MFCEIKCFLFLFFIVSLGEYVIAESISVSCFLSLDVTFISIPSDICLQGHSRTECEQYKFATYRQIFSLQLFSCDLDNGLKTKTEPKHCQAQNTSMTPTPSVISICLLSLLP